MAGTIIPISSDSSKDSVGSHLPRVILFGSIPAIIPVIPVVPAEVPIVPADPLVASEVGTVSVTSPVGVLDLVDYSSSFDFDPSEDSLPLAPELPLVSPFLCSNDLEADSETELAKQRPERHESLTVHDAMVLRWRDRLASRPSSPSGSSFHDTLAPSSEFPLAPVVAPHGIRRRPTILVRPGEAIPFGRPYRTHPNGPHFTSDSSSSGSSSNFSSDTSSGPSTRVALPRLVYLPVVTLRYSEAFRRWRSAPLSTPYPPTMLESSLDSSSKRSLDSSSPSAGPSRKRCRSPTTLVPSSTPISRSIAPTHAGLLPPSKRFRDPYSPEVSREEHIEIGTVDAEAIADLGISNGVGVDTEDGIGMGVEIAASDIREDEEEFETAQRQLEAGWENLRVRALLCIERYRVDNLRHHMALSHEEFCQIYRDHDDSRRRLRRLESFVEKRLGFRP
ncbi:hypothetical protein Tco_1498526 [Tanacetum coccineum]